MYIYTQSSHSCTLHLYMMLYVLTSFPEQEEYICPLALSIYSYSIIVVCLSCSALYNSTCIQLQSVVAQYYTTFCMQHTCWISYQTHYHTIQLTFMCYVRCRMSITTHCTQHGLPKPHRTPIEHLQAFSNLWLTRSYVKTCTCFASAYSCWEHRSSARLFL